METIITGCSIYYYYYYSSYQLFSNTRVRDAKSSSMYGTVGLLELYTNNVKWVGISIAQQRSRSCHDNKFREIPCSFLKISFYVIHRTIRFAQ